MKTTILGIEVDYETVRIIKDYLKARNNDIKKEQNYTGWQRDYSLARAECKLDEIEKEGKITNKDNDIIRRFLNNLEFSFDKIRLYGKWESRAKK